MVTNDSPATETRTADQLTLSPEQAACAYQHLRAMRVHAAYMADILAVHWSAQAADQNITHSTPSLRCLDLLAELTEVLTVFQARYDLDETVQRGGADPEAGDPEPNSEDDDPSLGELFAPTDEESSASEPSRGFE